MKSRPKRRLSWLVNRFWLKAWGWHPPDWLTLPAALGLIFVVVLWVGAAVDFSPLGPEDGGAADTRRDKGGGLDAGKAPPTKPPPNAKTKCAKDERRVYGACYVVLKAEPPCPEHRYEYGGECLEAVYVPPSNAVEE